VVSQRLLSIAAINLGDVGPPYKSSIWDREQRSHGKVLSELKVSATKEFECAFCVAVKNVRWQQFKPEEKEYVDHAKYRSKLCDECGGRIGVFSCVHSPTSCPPFVRIFWNCTHATSRQWKRRLKAYRPVVRTSLKNGVLTIQMDNPSKLNSWGAQMMNELFKVNFANAAVNPDVKAVVLYVQPLASSYWRWRMCVHGRLGHVT
jgi:hypothetical protein